MESYRKSHVKSYESKTVCRVMFHTGGRDEIPSRKREGVKGGRRPRIPATTPHQGEEETCQKELV